MRGSSGCAMSEEMKCLDEKCSKVVPLVKLEAQSSSTWSVFYCPVCGSRHSTATPEDELKEKARSVASAAWNLSTMIKIVRILHGDIPEAGD
jgi:hypothetical protein